MLNRKLVSSWKSAALASAIALGFVPTLAAHSTDVEPTLRASETRGIASGTWTPATLAMPGLMHGKLYDDRGDERFEIAAITHRIVPSEVPGCETGDLCGRLISPRQQLDPIDPKAEPSKTQVEPASIYVLGHWSVQLSDGAGRFSGVAYVELAPLPMPLVLLDIAGSFQLAVKPVAEPPKGSPAANGTVRFQAKWMTRD